MRAKKSRAGKASKSRGGRPKGSRTGYTVEGLTLAENHFRAMWGPLHAAGPGAGWAHQLWIERNLPLDRDEFVKGALADGMTPAQADTAWRNRAERREQYKDGQIDPWFVKVMLDAIAKRDAKFFEDAAGTLRRIAENGKVTLDDHQEMALASFVGAALRERPTRTFGPLIDSVNWRGPAPSERNLKRLCKKHGVPRTRGRPSKK